MASLGQRLVQPENLPLPTAHFATAIEMEDLHGFFSLGSSRALAYFMKV